MKKVLITGVTGFLGRNLAKYLVESGWNVEGIVRKSSNIESLKKFVGKDIKLWCIEENNGLENMFECNHFDVVIHLASVSIVDHKSTDIDNMISSNILLGTKLLENMVKHDCMNLVNIGSVWQNIDVDSLDYHPMDLYAATKEAFMNIIKFYEERKKLNCINLKLFDTYGADDSRGKILNLLKRQLGEEGPKLDVTAGEQEIDFVYVTDVCSCIRMAAQYLQDDKIEMCNTYMVSGNNKMSLKNVAEKMEKISGKKLNVNWGGRPYRKGEVMKTWRAGKILPGWTPSISIDEGLKMFLGQ